MGDWLRSQPVWVLSAIAVFMGGLLALVCIFSALLVLSPPLPTQNVVAANPTAIPPAPDVAPTIIPTPVDNFQPQITPLVPDNRPPTQISSDNTSASPRPINQNRPAPDAVVSDYYQTVTQNQAQTWEQLSDNFKQKFNCCAPNYNYNGYLNWWNSVERATVTDARIFFEETNYAIVYANINYRMKSGGDFNDSEPYFLLVYDDVRGQWLFEDKGNSPGFQLP